MKAATKPAVYVICRVQRNRDGRRFYNPPVDGRNAGYAEWQPAYKKYLEQRFAFSGVGPRLRKISDKGSRAQGTFDGWIANARARRRRSTGGRRQ